MDYPRQKGKNMVGQTQITHITQSSMVQRSTLLLRLWALFAQGAILEGPSKAMLQQPCEQVLPNDHETDQAWHEEGWIH